MFLSNKYTIWYYQIINNRKVNAVSGYTENHHIIPKSLGGSNKKDNLVKLTAREHFACHRLLVKMTTGQAKTKISYAIRCMMNQENQHQVRYKINSRTYAQIMKETKSAISADLSGNRNPFYNKKHSDDSRKKMKAKRAQQIIPKRPNKVYSPETIEKWRDANKLQFEDPAQVELRSKKSKDLWADPEWRGKYKGNTGKAWYNNGIKSRLVNPLDIPLNWVPGRLLLKKVTND